MSGDLLHARVINGNQKWEMNSWPGEQPGAEPAFANAAKRTGEAAVQVDVTSAEVFRHARLDQ